jgi:large repetitive protein
MTPGGRLAAAAAAAGAFVLNWNAAAGAKTYNVYRLPTGGSWQLLKSGITTTTYKDTTASGPFPFAYYVTAVGATELEGGPSNTVSVTPR